MFPNIKYDYTIFPIHITENLVRKVMIPKKVMFPNCLNFKSDYT